LTQRTEEGVTWEAKAEDPAGEGRIPGRLQARKIAQGVCALANQVGGYFIVGARKEEDAWKLPGITRPSSEPGLWLDQILAGLQPQPRLVHKHWKVDDDWVVALIRVEPLAETPCMTRDGQVFERVSSETLKVKDPVRLNELFRRGREARDVAEAGAHLASTELFEYPGIFNRRSVWIGLGLMAASYKPDIGSLLFHSEFNQAIHKGFGDRLCIEAGLSPPQAVEPIMRQSFVAPAGGNDLYYWVVSAHWSGRVGVLAALAGDMVLHQSLFDSFVIPAWNLAADLVEHLGGYGDARMELSVRVQTDEVAQRRATGSRRPGPAPPPRTLYGKLPPETNIPRPHGDPGTQLGGDWEHPARATACSEAIQLRGRPQSAR
jgi:schlafen family protein